MKMTADADDDYCLKWNNHHSTFMSTLSSLLKKEMLVDVTLAAEGKFVEAHKLVLCTCSEYFQDVLGSHENKQAYIFLSNVSFEDLTALLDYMYIGEVNVSQKQLPRFLAAAQTLKIKGLCDKPVDPPASETVDGQQDKVVVPKIKAEKKSPKRLEKVTKPSSSSANKVPSKSSQPSAGFAKITRHNSQGSTNDSLVPSEAHFVCVNEDENTDPESAASNEGLGTLGNVWSLSQQGDGNAWDNSRSEEGAENGGSNSVECYVPHLSELEMTGMSTDYDGYPGATAQLDNNDPASHDPPPGIEENISGPSSSTTLTRRSNHRRSLPTDEYVHVCPNCGRRYSQRGSLSRHLKFECGMVPKFPCHLCSMRFRRAYSLREHINRIHSSNE